MNKLEYLLQQASDSGCEVENANLTAHSGLYGDGMILLSKDLKTTAEKTCILAEELGHHYTATGDITGDSVSARKQELMGRKIAYETLVPLEALAAAVLGSRSAFEIAETLQITEAFLREAVAYYHGKYGVCVSTSQGELYFSPLGVLKKL